MPWKAPFVGTRGSFSVRTPVMNQIKSILSNHLDKMYINTGEIHWYTEGVAVDLIFLMPIPKSVSKKMRMKMISGEIRPTTRPDRGNLLKLIEDVIQDVLIQDDAKIVDGRVAKYYSDEPKTVIRIYPFSEYDLRFGNMIT